MPTIVAVPTQDPRHHRSASTLPPRQRSESSPIARFSTSVGFWHMRCIVLELCAACMVAQRFATRGQEGASAYDYDDPQPHRQGGGHYRRQQWHRVRRCPALGRRQGALEAAVAQLGHNVTGVRGDVANPADLDGLYNEVQQQNRKIDILFANAGVAQPANDRLLRPAPAPPGTTYVPTWAMAAGALRICAQDTRRCTVTA